MVASVLCMLLRGSIGHTILWRYKTKGHVICGHIRNYIKGSACPLVESLLGTCMASVYNPHVLSVIANVVP